MMECKALAQIDAFDAAPDSDNCYCQCHRYTYQDNNGKVHGNCKS